VERPVETITYDRPAGSAPQRAPPAESFAHLPVNETVEIVPEAVWEDPSFYEHIGEELTFEVDLVPSLRGPSTARTRSARPPLRPPCPAPPLGLPPRRVGRPPVRATSDAFPVVPPSVGFSALAGLIQLTQEWPKGAPFGDVDGVKHKTKLTPQTEANQTVRWDLGTKDGVKSMRIGFTDQRLTAHGGLAVWTRFVTERGLREQLRAVLPHTPTSPNAYDPCDTALGFIGGILCGADKLARVAHLAHDPAVAEVLGIEAIPSQSTLSRFFAQCGRSAGEALSGLHRWVLEELPSRTEGYTLDLDSFSLLHEDGHQEGVRVGYTRKGLKPCHRPIAAALAEVPRSRTFGCGRATRPASAGRPPSSAIRSQVYPRRSA